MIENFNDLMSFIVLILTPIIILLIVGKPLFRGFSADVDNEQDPQIEYYKEW